MLFSRSSKFYTIAMFFALVFPALTASAQDKPQNWCGSDEHWEQKAQQNPQLYQQRVDMLTSVMGTARHNKTGDSMRTIPVVFHIIHTYGAENISKAQIEAQLKTINECYAGANTDTSGVREQFKPLIADAQIQFRLARTDPSGSCTDGIERIYSSLTVEAGDNVKALSQWNPDHYLNIWVVSSIASFGTGGTILGYAQFPWDNNASSDGILVRADQITAGNKTLTHEIGHYLGLFHTFESALGRECGRNCSTSGDWICDTPPTAEANYGCPKDLNSCTQDVPDRPDMIENFMDYSSCTRMFTVGQKTRMDDYLSTSKRSLLITPENMVATGLADTTTTVYCKPKADFYAVAYTICEGSNIRFKDNSYNSDITQYDWSFQGGQPASSTQKDPVVKFDSPGIYTVALKVSNPAGTDQLVRDAIIKVLPAVSTNKAPFYEGFEQLDSLQNGGWNTTDDTNGLSWQVTDLASATGKKAIFLNNLAGTTDKAYTVSMPAMDMSTASSYKLTFRIAYAQVNSSSADEFRVQLSTTCGQGFSSIFTKIGSSLSTTAGPVSSYYIPASDEWEDVSLDLSSFKSIKNLIVRFSLTNKNGNNMYIDDINLAGAAVPASLSEETAVTGGIIIYPNPTAGGITLNTSSLEASSATLSIFDLSGRKIRYMNDVQVGGTPLTFSREALNISKGGMYYVEVCTKGNKFVQKLVVLDK